MNEFDKRLNEALSRYVEKEHSADVPHEYAPENARKAEEITEKTKKTIQRRFPMKRRFAAALVCALVLVSSAVVYAASPAVREYINMLFLREDSAGRLTEVPDGYVGVYTAEDLDNVRKDLNGKYILMNDIDLGGKNFVPIGDSSDPFTGIFNGNGYVISGLVVDGAYDYAGLFGYCRRFSDWTDLTAGDRQISGGIIKNLGLTDGAVLTTGKYHHQMKNEIAYAGAIAGYADYIVGCYTENFSVTVDNSADNLAEISLGGVVGRAYFVDSCYSDAVVSLNDGAADSAEEVFVSGISGYSFSCVTSYFSGSIDSGDYPDYGVTYCQEYDVPIVLTETSLNEIAERLDALDMENTDPNKKTWTDSEGNIHSWNAAKLMAFYCNSTHFVYLDLPYQSYITSDEAGENYYLLDPETKPREYDELSKIIALAFPNNTFREFCIEHHIKSGYYACYDLRDTPDCTFDGFDFNYIWYDRTSPKLRLFKETKKSDAMIAYENGWIKIKD